MAAAAGCGGAPPETGGNSAAASAGEHDPLIGIGSHAFVSPHPFEVVRTRTFTAKLAAELGEQTVIVYAAGDNGKDVEIVRGATQGGAVTLELPDTAPEGSLYLKLEPFKLSETSALTFWPHDTGGLERLEYGWFDSQPDHATVDCQGVVLLEGGTADLSVRSETTGTELHRYTLKNFEAWVDPNGYAPFNAPIEGAKIAKAGEVLSVHAITPSRDQILGCSRVERDGEQDALNFTHTLVACP
jgi:hypothetical protein